MQRAVRVVGKRPSRRPPKLIASVGHLLYAEDTSTGCFFLVDSGAQVSVTPAADRATPSTFLAAANGTRIPAWGCLSLPVVLDGRQFGLHKFIRAGVDRPILGADFFTSTGLTIDVKNRRLCQSAGARSFSIPLFPAPSTLPPALGLLCPSPPADALRGHALPPVPAEETSPVPFFLFYFLPYYHLKGHLLNICRQGEGEGG